MNPAAFLIKQALQSGRAALADMQRRALEAQRLAALEADQAEALGYDYELSKASPLAKGLSGAVVGAGVGAGLGIGARSLARLADLMVDRAGPSPGWGRAALVGALLGGTGLGILSATGPRNARKRLEAAAVGEPFLTDEGEEPVTPEAQALLHRLLR